VIERILKPQIIEAPSHVFPLFLLDSYRCHSVKVEHIPGGCTSLCQPVEVRVAKLLKDELRNQWESWMIKEEAAQD